MRCDNTKDIIVTELPAILYCTSNDNRDSSRAVCSNHLIVPYFLALKEFRNVTVFPPPLPSYLRLYTHYATKLLRYYVIRINI